MLLCSGYYQTEDSQHGLGVKSRVILSMGALIDVIKQFTNKSTAFPLAVKRFSTSF